VTIVFGLYLSPLPPGVTMGVSLFLAGLPISLSYAVSGFDALSILTIDACGVISICTNLGGQAAPGFSRCMADSAPSGSSMSSPRTAESQAVHPANAPDSTASAAAVVAIATGLLSGGLAVSAAADGRTAIFGALVAVGATLSAGLASTHVLTNINTPALVRMAYLALLLTLSLGAVGACVESLTSDGVPTRPIPSESAIPPSVKHNKGSRSARPRRLEVPVAGVR
jgi:hypothetical protein